MAEKMKPSGIAWIGDIPQSWNLLKLKYFSYLKGRIGWQGLTADEFIDEGPYLITGTDFENGRIQFDRSYHISEKRYEEAPEIQLSVGDLLVTKDGTVGKMAYVDELPGKSSLNSHLLLIRPLNNKFDNRFLFWLMGSSVFTGYTDYAQDGTVMASLSQEKIGNLLAYFPPLREQQVIADYLDVQCAKIDSIATDLEKQIELLQKYKKSLITETVTKGLDKSVPMKDSGIDWIPYDIPEKWNTKKIKHIFSLRDEKNYLPLEEVNLISLYTDLGVVQHSDLETTTGNKAYTADGYNKVYVNDIVVNIILCWMGAIGISKYEGVTSPAYDVYYAKDNDTISPLYYHYLFQMERFHGKCYSVGRGIMAMRWRTYSSEFRNIDVPVPPFNEQKKIAEFLSKKCSEIEAIIAEKESQLDSISKYKKSLIYEYVTGKKRVKEAEQWQSKAAN